tara:strand:- start:9322 stop:10632 length:1311 start_codon:yes stop_codon:yes gene_type:complete
MNSLIEKIENRQARVGVIGLGYVGLPLLIEFGNAGFPISGLDIDPTKIERLKKGESYIKHIPFQAIAKLVANGEIELTTDFSAISRLDIVLLCVPTPLTHHRDPDMTYIVNTARAISPHIKPGQMFILESTTYPGTTRDILIPALEANSHFKAGRDFFVAYSPEREDPNNKEFTTSNIPKVVGADSKEELATADALYQCIVNKTVLVSDSQTAEATKLMENIFRSVNIALVNEMKIILDKMGIDVWEVIEAAKTKPFGFMPFYPGPGLGGHCIPIDPFYLTWKAREFEVPTRFVELAGEINVSMPEYVFNKILMGLNDSGKSIRGSRILILGIAYKKDIDDSRESPSYKIMDMLSNAGAWVDYNDPYVPEIGPRREFAQFIGKKATSLENIGEYDLTVILTDHSVYDFFKIVESSKIIVDTRNACKNIESDKIIKA